MSASLTDSPATDWIEKTVRTTNTVVVASHDSRRRRNFSKMDMSQFNAERIRDLASYVRNARDPEKTAIVLVMLLISRLFLLQFDSHRPILVNSTSNGQANLPNGGIIGFSSSFRSSPLSRSGAARPSPSAPAETSFVMTEPAPIREALPTETGATSIDIASHERAIAHGGGPLLLAVRSYAHVIVPAPMLTSSPSVACPDIRKMRNLRSLPDRGLLDLDVGARLRNQTHICVSGRR